MEKPWLLALWRDPFGSGYSHDIVLLNIFCLGPTEVALATIIEADNFQFGMCSLIVTLSALLSQTPGLNCVPRHIFGQAQYFSAHLWKV